MEKNDLNIACEDVGLYYETNLLRNKRMDIVIIAGNPEAILKGKAYNIKTKELYKIHSQSSLVKHIFIKGSDGFLMRGFSDRILNYYIKDDIKIEDLEIVKRINSKEGVVKLGELLKLQEMIDVAIKYQDKLNTQSGINKKFAEDAKLNYSKFGL